MLTADEIKQVGTVLDKKQPAIAAIVRLRLLTAQRGGEVRWMRWDEVDIRDGWWTIPAERSKNRLPHRVPLSPRVVEILTGLPRTAGQWVFPSPVGMDQPLRYIEVAWGASERGPQWISWGMTCGGQRPA